MLLGMEIVFTILGITILVKGRVSLGRDKLVVGAPAYVMGVLLVATIPAAIITCFAAALFFQTPQMGLIGVEAGTVIIVPILAALIGVAAGKPSVADEDLYPHQGPSSGSPDGPAMAAESGPLRRGGGAARED